MKRRRFLTVTVGAMILGGALMAMLSTIAVSSIALADQEKPCTIETVAGRYGVQTAGFSDFVPGPVPSKIADFVPITSVGTVEFLRDGTMSGSELGNIGALVLPFTYTGSYTVNPDCTASLTRDVSISGREVQQLVMVQGGKKILLMGRSPAGILYWGQMERISDRKIRQDD